MTTNMEAVVGVSVIVCTHNGRFRLPPVLDALRNQDIGHHTSEIIVVENASSDGTWEWLNHYAATVTDVEFCLVQEMKPGLNHARLKGIAMARFNILLFCDDDNVLSTRYLLNGIEYLQQNPMAAVLGGCGVPVFDGEKPDWFDSVSHSFAVGHQWSHSGRISYLPAEVYGAGAFFRRSFLKPFFDAGFAMMTTDRIGGKLVSGGDVELCYIAQLTGGEVHFKEDLSFLHHLPEQRLNWLYYVKLKCGIAASAGMLAPYRYWFRRRGSTPVFYIIFLLGCIIRELVMLMGLCFKQLIFGFTESRKWRQLAIYTSHARIASYVGAFRSGFRHLGALNEYHGQLPNSL